MKKKIGLLPLYIALYDAVVPQLRERLESFYQEITREFEKRDIEVVTPSFCRVCAEFQSTVAQFEREKVDAIVTLHMAYSPSLESVDVLCNTKLPIIVLDTTQTLEFTAMQDPDEINYNHGIHGVMDLCSMLTRRGKAYAIAAGHYAKSDVIDRVCGYLRATVAARALQSTSVGLIGGLFEGMGDFQVPFAELKSRFGVTVVEPKAKEMKKICVEIDEDAINRERAADAKRFDFADHVIEDEYRDSLRAGLAVRRWIEQKELNAFTINFTRMGEESGLSRIPFVECCKAMERGTGYAGEGDVLTAAFVGAFLRGYDETNFVEIFCPDWKNNTLFLSHMGEVNYRVSAVKPCINRAATNYSPGGFPYAGYTRMKGGKGVYVNISHAEKDFRMTVAAAEMLEQEEDNFPMSMRGWMRPIGKTTAEFLEGLSHSGATHHSIFVYGATVEELRHFGQLLDLETVVL